MSGPVNSYQGNQHGYQGQPENQLAVYLNPDDYEQPFKVGKIWCKTLISIIFDSKLHLLNNLMK